MGESFCGALIKKLLRVLMFLKGMLEWFVKDLLQILACEYIYYEYSRALSHFKT